MSTETVVTENLGAASYDPDPPILCITVGPKAPLAVDGTLPPQTTFPMDRTWTISHLKEYVLIAQDDGNLVLYRVYGNAPVKEGDKFQGQAQWGSKTDKVTRPQDPGNHACFQDDGNFVIYSSPDNDPKKGIWNSDTGGIVPIALVVEDGKDGDFVIYKREAAWHSKDHKN